MQHRRKAGQGLRWGHMVLGLPWRLWAVCGLILWLFMPPPQDSHAACAPWEGGPCIDVRPPETGGGSRPPREDQDGEPSPRRSGPGCASMPTRPAPVPDEPRPVAGAPHPTLPHVVWGEGGRFRPAEGYRWVRPGDPQDFRVEPVPAGTPHPRLPNVVWAGDGEFRPAEGYRWVRPNDPADFRVEPYPEGTPHASLPNVVWAGSNGEFRPAPGYEWRYPEVADDFQTVRLVTVAQWVNTWQSADHDVARAALRGIQNEDLMVWMAAHVEFGRFADDHVSPLSAAGSMLRFKDSYFDARTPPAQRENLLAFEGGKVFYETMKNVQIGDGRTFERWFLGFYPSRSSVISEMSTTSHRGQPLGTSDLIDAHSAFAHLFRAEALALPRPKGYWQRQAWEAAQQEFLQYLDLAMRGR